MSDRTIRLVLAIGDPKPERWTEPLKSSLPGASIEVFSENTPIGEADYAIVWRPPAALFEQQTRLKAIFCIGAGVDGLIAVPTLPDDVPVVRLENAGMAVQMAEYVAYQIIDVSRDMSLYREQQARNIWKPQRPIDRPAWPVGIMGLGQIGGRVAKMLTQLEYPVHGWSRSRHEIDQVRSYAGQDEFKDFLNASRILVNTLPLTDDTRGIINAETIDQLLPEAVIINVGRGGHLNENDLLKALAERRVMRAALDVFENEPLPEEYPFWRDPHIRITPHVAATTLRNETIAQIADKILALEAGRTITGIVDRQYNY
ncbi:MAG: glyoxylate/hydroxypyruvate reductase A [unclassified Hahellaceae]|nr:glyoxylate/hydroxypyruvate reductase A [Hahellaceae bacterium]|tara:strand:+ start:40986 stop:41930 length:945 start_codon:yes stop_codon:yes gene_type:complete